MQGLILAAGQGKRFSGGKIKALMKVKGEYLITGLIEKFRRFGIEKIIIVTGYRRLVIEEKLNSSGADFIHNPFFKYSDNLVSFWVGARRMEDDCLLSHCDLIFDDELLGRVVESQGDIVIPYDRTSIDKEAMKIRVRGGNIIAMSKSIPVDEAFGESIPLMKFSHKAVKSLAQMGEAIIESGGMNQYFENALAGVVKQKGLSIDLIDVSGCRWIEIDNQQDFERAEELFQIGN